MAYLPILPDYNYAPKHPEMRVLGEEQTLARLRHEGKGCAYIKIGGRVVYRGSDVLAYLERNTIKTSG